MIGSPEGLEYARRAAQWAGIELRLEHERMLAVYADWLRSEASNAGGIGPAEAVRVWPRHVADALTFAAGWRDRPPPPTLIDIGSGVGLPGIPLAITHPGTAVTLLDRSGRRSALAQRAIRILNLENATTRIGDAERDPGAYAAATMRAALPLPEGISVVERFLEPGGVGVLGSSRKRSPQVAHDSVTVLEIPVWVLDSPAWLLRMARPT